MRREDCVELFKRIPEHYHAQVNLVMRTHSVISVDIMVRCEPTYLVVRGREGGSTDEGRAFFLPYDEISYFRIERVVKLGELKRMYGEEGHIDTEDKLGQQAVAEAAAKEASQQLIATPAPVPTPAPPTDPASIAKQNLLDRIRAARAGANGATGKLK
jgi:hypothetical protein